MNPLTLIPYPLSLIPDRSEELLLYNSMELSSIASVSDDLIEWGKWDYGNTCLLNQVNSLYIQNGIFRDGNCGFKSTDVDSIFCEELLINNCFGETGAISLDFVPNGYIKQNIIINTFIGIYLDNESSPQVNNNYIKSVEEGIYSRYSCLSIINNNEIICNNLGISIRGLCNETINYNNIYARIGVDIKPTGYSGSSIANINNNNINGIDFAIKIMGTQWGHNVNDIDANNNYYYTNNEDLINALVFDKNDVEEGSIPFTGLVLWEPFETQQLLNAGIQ